MTNVVVLGMHRSGTSMVAHQLTTLGLNPGSEDDLLLPREDNPAGFWERRDVVELNDSVLASAGGAWFMPPDSGCFDAAHSDARVAAVVAALPVNGWVLKDPRLLLTWPAWRHSLHGALCVLVYRGPAAVAASLKQRNGFPLALGLALWEYYNRLALDIASEHGVLAVSYEAFARDPDGQSQALFTRMVALGAEGLSRPESSVFDSSLQHAASESGALAEARALLTPAQLTLDKLLNTACEVGGIFSSAALPADPLLLTRIRDMASAMPELAIAREIRLENRDLQSRLDFCDAQMQREKDAFLQLQTERKTLLEERDVLAVQLEKLGVAHESAVAAQRAAARQCEETASELESARSAFREASSESVRLLHVITNIYSRLLGYELSFSGGLQRRLRRMYAILRFRSFAPGYYDSVLEDAKRHFIAQDLLLPGRLPGKIAQLRTVWRYVLKHPVSSFRSLSLFRLRRALDILIHSSAADFGVWVQSRFPENANLGEGNVPSELGPELDTLELDFPAPMNPLVSIIVPVFNSYRMTIHCLSSLLENTAGVNYEVILADDHSTDLTQRIGQRIRNIKVIRSNRNQGFLLNCNAAAAAASGRYLVLLNNDTSVSSGWLEPMLRLMEERPDAGVVGPRLMFPDGKLQEAGGIVWRDGSGWNYGRSDDSSKPEYMYVKEVDYVSGACLMIRAALWTQLGGFDTRYAPAYYEDTDLCFEIRKAGFKVMYQPHSAVFHYEGVSNGTDPAKGVKRYQDTNREIFCAKWHDVLQREHFPNSEHVFLARDRSRSSNCILVIDHYVPHYDKDAGSRSTLMYIRLMLAMGFKVVFLGANFFPHQPYTRMLQDLGVEVLVGEHSARHIDNWLHDNAQYIHRIFLHRPHIAEQFLPHIYKMRPRPEIVFFGHDLHYLRIERERELFGDAGSNSLSITWKKRELAVFDKVDRVYYPSSVEVEVLRRENPNLKVRAIPLYVFEDSVIPPYAPACPQDIIFVAGFNHPPNVDGLSWFIQEVIPLLAQQCPDFHLYVVGSNPTAAVLEMQSEQVTILGYLPDEELAALYRKVGCSVVPLRYGAGVKGKVLEAVRHGLPLVTTGIGAEGIPEAADIMFVADNPAAFAGAIAAILQGTPQVPEKLRLYGPWLQQHFGRAQAEEIILEDFGPVVSRFASAPNVGGPG